VPPGANGEQAEMLTNMSAGMRDVEKQMASMQDVASSEAAKFARILRDFELGSRKGKN
jgi:hypothetical protein